MKKFTMPAEWAPHLSTWFTWPHNPATWPGCLEKIGPIYAQMAAHLSAGEVVNILCKDVNIENSALNLIKASGVAANFDNIKFHQVATNDSWIRDYGPIFLKNAEGQRKILHFKFNMWGGKYPPWDLDNLVPSYISNKLDVPEQKFDIVLEGGSIEVNGAGVMLTTEQCLLNANRNPHLNKTQIEKLLVDAFALDKLIWLPGGIEGDDTDGHIDDLARFVDEKTILAVVENNPDDENYQILQDNLTILKAATNQHGEKFNIIEIPMPAPIDYDDVGRLPASYANFYIGNACVLVPIFGDKNDQVVLDILQKCYPTRKIVGIDSKSLVVGLGAFHCLTQQEPS